MFPGRFLLQATCSLREKKTQLLVESLVKEFFWKICLKADFKCLTFQGRTREVRKIVKLLKSSVPASVAAPDSASPSPSKKAKIEHSEVNPKVKPNELLNKADKKLLLDGEWLNDIHINLAQRLLSKQFPQLSGLCSTLLLPQAKQLVPAGTSALQIIHTRGNNWIVASTIGCQPGEVKLFDSMSGRP